MVQVLWGWEKWDEVRGGEEKQSKNCGMIGVQCWPQDPPLSLTVNEHRPLPLHGVITDWSWLCLKIPEISVLVMDLSLS